MDRLDLHAFVDGELDAPERKRAESAIASSPELTREIEAIRHLKATVASHAKTHECSTTWNACKGRLDEIDKARKVEGFVGKYAWALCVCFLFAILAGGYFNRLNGTSMRSGEVASMASSLIPIQTRPGEVKTYINDVVGRRPEMRIDDSRVTSFKVAPRSDRPIACLGIRDGEKELSLLIIPGVTGVEGVQPMGGGMYAGKMGRSNFITWGDNGCAVVLTGEGDHEHLREVAVSLYR